MSDQHDRTGWTLSDSLRWTAGGLINGDVEDGAVETDLLVRAADEIDRLTDELIVMKGLHLVLHGEVEKLRSQLVRAGALIQFLEDEAARYAEMYPASSDGRNTFVIFRDMIAGEKQRLSRAALTDEKGQP